MGALSSLFILLSLLPKLLVDPIMASTDDLDAWEDQSTQVLNAIRSLIDALRSAPYPQENAVGLKNQSERRPSNIENSLVDHLRSCGVFDLVHQLSGRQVCDSSNEQASLSEAAVSDKHPLHLATDDRHQILHVVTFPLLAQLHACYTILDNAPDTPVSQYTSGRGKNKPLPTKGMLSLKDYTNVACLLEFAICSSLLPRMGYYSFLDEGKHVDRSKAIILVQQRSRSLPKSLAGRMSSKSLAWGMHAAADGWTLTAFTTNGEMQGAAADARNMMLYQNYKELSQLAISVGRLVLLDRFRPMLLPRHVADLFMVMLFLERFKWSIHKEMKSQSDDSSLDILRDAVDGDELEIGKLHSAFLFTPLQISTTIHTHQSVKSTNKTEAKPIDYREAALAFRTLLGGDAIVVMSSQSADASLQQQKDLVLKMPPWIRMRLGQCLTKLAENDLHAVADVFVTSARSIGSESAHQDEEIMTGAASRLARVLCSKPSSDSGSNSTLRFQKQLCDQFINFLVAEGELMYRKLINRSEESKNEVLERKLSRSCLAMMHTLWAFFGQIPETALHSFFVTRLSSGLIPSDHVDASSTECLTSLQSTSAICFWLSAMPSTHLDPSARKKLHSMLLNSIPSTSCTKSDYTILGQILRFAAMFRQGDSDSKLVVEINSDLHANNAMQLIAEMALNQILHSLLWESTDAYSIALEVVKAVAADQFDREGYTFCASHTVPRATLPAPVYTRSANISQPAADILKEVEQRGNTMVDVVIAPIAAVAESIIADTEKCGTLDRIECSLPGALFRLVLMMHFYTSYSTNDDSRMAAKANAKLSQYGLVDLLKNDFHASRIAATVMLGFLCEKCSPSAILLSTSRDQKEVNADILELLAIIIDCAAFHMEKDQATNNVSSNPHELFSTSSIVVSLLVSLLELGAEKRSDHDENTLQSMMPSLQILSISTRKQFHPKDECGNRAAELHRELAELAEMSSHAMALIVARKNDDNDSISRQESHSSKSGIELIAEQLSFAERDLESSQPPLRAKAVVSLRHIARSFNTASATSDITQEEKAMVTEVHQPSSVAIDDQAELIVRSLARICFISLSDAESYVYLASIQTLVAICDVSPSVILPLTATLVAKGTTRLAVLVADAKVEDVALTLNPEQTIKAAEALIFIIRRRGDAIFLHHRLLFDLLLFGSEQHQDKPIPRHENSLNIQRQTHTYFIEAHDSDERQVRVNTGGPVFKLEEGDLLRATSISVVCELVTVLKPSSVAPFCHVLVKLVIDAMQLDDSRPVHRAAATLARELYICIENEVSSNDNSPTTASLAVAMACSQERLLYSIIQSYASVGYATSNGKKRYIDAATQSRCAEAVETRDNLESLSVFGAAAFVANSMKVEDDPMVKAVRKALAR